MKIIDQYLIKKFIGPFALTFAFALVILLMQFLWLYVDEMVGKGLEIHIILELLLYASATMVAMAAPLSVLLSSLMTFGSLGEHYEIVALKAAGVPISKLMLPLAVFCIIIASVAFVFDIKVTPKAYAKMKTLLYDIREQKPTLSIEEGTFYDGFDNYVIRIGKKHQDNETIEDVTIYDHSKRQGNTTMTHAKRGSMKITPDGQYMLFTLQDGFFWDESKSKDNKESKLPLSRATFKEQYRRFDLSSFQIQKTDESLYKSSTKALSIEELQVEIDTIKKYIANISINAINNYFNNLQAYKYIIDTTQNITRDTTIHYTIDDVIKSMPLAKQNVVFDYAEQTSNNNVNTIRFSYEEEDYRNQSLWSYQLEWHRKFTMPIACILFFFIGAPLGSIIRKGGIGIPLLVTILFFALYFSLSIFGEKLAKGSVFPVGLGMWLSSLVLLPICLFLTRKATVDSAMFSIDGYTQWFKKIKNIKKGSRKGNENTTNMS